MKAKTKNRYDISFLIVLFIVVLCFCVFVGSILAWLTIDYSFEDDNTVLGSVELELYANGTKVTGTTTTVNGVNHWSCDEPYEVSGSTTSRTLNLKVRNAGNIDALVRATIRIYYLDENNNQVTVLLSSSPTLDNQISMSATGWVTNFPSETVAAGYMFYNSKISPYVVNGATVSSNEIEIINSITVASSQATTKFYVSVTVDGIAYAGNIYRKIELGETSSSDIPVSAYPFGTKETLPSAWTAWK